MKRLHRFNSKISHYAQFLGFNSFKLFLYEVAILERKMHFNETTRFAVFIEYIYIAYIISRRNFCYAHFVLQIFDVYMHQ